MPGNITLRQRLLQDIAELQANPYPNITLSIQDDNLQNACLLLTPNGQEPLHLTIQFGAEYPLEAPTVTIESKIEHPNVFGSYICASVLNTTEGYTPAYTLKSIAIQLLSFFSSERIEQEGGWYSELTSYNRYPILASNTGREGGSPDSPELDRSSTYCCSKCGFGGSGTVGTDLAAVGQIEPLAPSAGPIASSPEVDANNVAGTSLVVLGKRDHDGMDVDEDRGEKEHQQLRLIDRILALPDEVLLLVLDELDTGDLLAAGKVCSKIGDFMTSHDTLRMREVQCFVFKKSFLSAKLGVGVLVVHRGRPGAIESEFDILSQEAYKKYQVRRSIQGIPFKYWLPLPISRRHWRSVKGDADTSLAQLAQAAGIFDRDDGENPNSEAIYNFMNNVVIKLSAEAEKYWGLSGKSTLTHASEKAVVSYFGLFHLLLCLATEQDQMVRDANRRCSHFLEGKTSKKHCPNLGQLLVAVLISDKGLTEDLSWAIINEAILRNVVWMLDPKGKGMAELSYIEPSPVSEYRLQRTFEASKTSYRLLMFLALFYKTARVPGKSLSDIRDEIFDAHGAPPRGTAESMAAEIRKIRTVNSFEEFFVAMGVREIPSKESFCTFLKGTIGESVEKGYSRWAISQAKALAIRQMEGKEPEVEQAEGVDRCEVVAPKGGYNFFPGKKGKERR